MSSIKKYSNPDQAARFADAKLTNNLRFLDITTDYDPSYVKGKRFALTGANRGLGLSLAKEITNLGGKVVALVRVSSKELDDLKVNQVVLNVDVTSDKYCSTFVKEISAPIDVLINCAGYFYEPPESLTKGTLNFAEELKMIDICALGPLRITNALYHANLLLPKSRVAMITSQGGSIAWREVQNGEEGGDYGHHMSKASANMMSVLLSLEFKKFDIAVGLIHPGFNKTEMTKKYEKIWEEEGAVDSDVGAKRVVHEIGLICLETTGKFINAEDGLEIPF